MNRPGSGDGAPWRWFEWRASIVDARGRRVPLIPTLSSMERGDADRVARLTAASRCPRDPPTPAQWAQGIVYGLIALPVLLAGSLLPPYIAFHLSMPWWARILVAIPGGVLPALATIFIIRRLAGQAMARDWARAGYCPSCGQDLTGTPADGDGCTVCPECGAAWRRAA